MLNKNLNIWLQVKAESDFSIHNIPFGIYTDPAVKHRVCSAIGEYIIDLAQLVDLGLLKCDKTVLEQIFLNDFISLGKVVTVALRNRIIEILKNGATELERDKTTFDKVFKKQSEVKMLMPLRV